MEYNSRTHTIQNIMTSNKKGLIKFDHYLQIVSNDL